jgi:hypothetical protein
MYEDVYVVQITRTQEKEAFDDEDRFCGWDTVYEKTRYHLMTESQVDTFEADNPPEDYPYYYVTVKRLFKIPEEDYREFKRFAFGMAIDPRETAEVYSG